MSVPFVKVSVVVSDIILAYCAIFAKAHMSLYASFHISSLDVIIMCTMSKRQIIILLGVLIIIIALFSGLPTLWNTIVYVVIGVLIVAVAYTIRPTSQKVVHENSVPFVDSTL